MKTVHLQKNYKRLEISNLCQEWCYHLAKKNRDRRAMSYNGKEYNPQKIVGYSHQNLVTFSMYQIQLFGFLYGNVFKISNNSANKQINLKRNLVLLVFDGHSYS